MRKLSICLATAAVALTAVSTAPATAYAAVKLHENPGGKMLVVKGGTGSADCGQILSVLQGICQGNGNLSGGNIPGVSIPDNSLTNPDFVIPNLPDSTAPDNAAPDGTAPDDVTPDEPDAGAAQDSFVQQVVRLVNEERAKAGLPALTVDAGASNAAQVRAKEIAVSFSHTRPNGSSFSTALTEAGAGFRGAGENIAYGQTTPEKVMEGWMNSSGHRANILNGNYTAIGVGHYKNSSGVDYWTQLFIQ